MSCPVCGFDPNPVETKVTDKELFKKRLRDIFTVHALESWWLTQPVYVLKELKKFVVNPKKILDVGCGDGRWWPAFKEIFPEAWYVGIDRLEDHITLNRENIPEAQWDLGDVRERAYVEIDTILLAGTLNPVLPELEQDTLLKRLLNLNSRYIICLFDRKQTGQPPDPWLNNYNKICTLLIPKEYSGPRQELEVWLYERK